MTKKQLELNIYNGTRGGRRPNSGRKRIHSKGVAHRTREHVTHRTPVHINFKVQAYKGIRTALKSSQREFGLSITLFSSIIYTSSLSP